MYTVNYPRTHSHIQSQGQREWKPCPCHEWGCSALQDGGQLSGAAHRADRPLLHVVRFWVHHSC